MTRPGQNAAATHVRDMVRSRGGTWRPHLIDAVFYDTRTAVALIRARVPRG